MTFLIHRELDQGLKTADKVVILLLLADFVKFH